MSSTPMVPYIELLPEELLGMILLWLDDKSVWYVYSHTICKRWHRVFVTHPRVKKWLNETRWGMYSLGLMRPKRIPVKMTAGLMCAVGTHIAIRNSKDELVLYTDHATPPRYICTLFPYACILRYSGDRYYVGYHDGIVRVYNADGAFNYTFSTEDDIVYDIFIDGGVTYTCVDFNVYVHDADGRLLHTLPHDEKVRCVLRHNDATYTCTTLSSVRQWTTPTTFVTAFNRGVRATSDMVVYDNRIHFASQFWSLSVSFDLMAWKETYVNCWSSIILTSKNVMFFVDTTDEGMRVQTPHRHWYIRFSPNVACVLDDGRLVTCTEKSIQIW